MNTIYTGVQTVLNEPRSAKFAPAGQSTQMIVGADDTDDSTILHSAQSLYGQLPPAARLLFGFQPDPRQPEKRTAGRSATDARTPLVSGRFPCAAMATAPVGAAQEPGKSGLGHRPEAGLGAAESRSVSAGPESRRTVADRAHSRHRLCAPPNVWCNCASNGAFATKMWRACAACWPRPSRSSSPATTTRNRPEVTSQMLYQQLARPADAAADGVVGMINLDCDDLFDTWRQQARWLLSHEIDPSLVSWASEGVGDLFASDVPVPDGQGPFRAHSPCIARYPGTGRATAASNAGVCCTKYCGESAMATARR